MDFKKYAQNLSWMQFALAGSLATNVLLAMASVIFMFSYSSREVVTRVIPPQMTRGAEIGSRAANAEYKKAFGLFFVNQVANLQPLSAPGIIDTMSTFVSPAIFGEFRKQALEVIKDPVLNAAAVSTDFSPSQVHYEKETDRVFVIGTLRTKGAGVDKTRNIVYELTVAISDGRPWITHFTSYVGNIPQSLTILMGKAKNKIEDIEPARQPVQRREETPEAQAASEIDAQGIIVQRDLPVRNLKEAIQTELKEKPAIKAD